MTKHPDEDPAWLLLEADDKISDAWNALHPEDHEGDIGGEYKVCKLCGGAITYVADIRREHHVRCPYVKALDALVALGNAIEEVCPSPELPHPFDDRVESTEQKHMRVVS